MSAQLSLSIHSHAKCKINFFFKKNLQSVLVIRCSLKQGRILKQQTSKRRDGPLVLIKCCTYVYHE
jgi:hypothetical protein